MDTELITVWNDMNDRLINFVKSKVKDTDLSKDIVQDVFLKVFSKKDTLKDKNKLVAWIYQITRNEVVSHFRKNKFELSSYDLQEDEVVENELTKEALEYLHPMINTLPEKYKEALILSDIENMSQKDMAHQLQISYSGAKSRIQRGRNMLRSTYNKCCDITTDVYGSVIDCKPKYGDNKVTK